MPCDLGLERDDNHVEPKVSDRHKFFPFLFDRAPIIAYLQGLVKLCATARLLCRLFGGASIARVMQVGQPLSVLKVIGCLFSFGIPVDRPYVSIIFDPVSTEGCGSFVFFLADTPNSS